MKHRTLLVVAATTAAALMTFGCSQPAAPAPTQAPAAPKAAEPTKAPAAAPAQPTAAPAAQKVNYPEKGKPITMYVGNGTGSGIDITARAAQPALEKVLGVPVPVMNVTGGSGQVSLTSFVKMKPDGYSIHWMSNPQFPIIYLDPDRKATWGRKDIQLVANYVWDPGVFSVKPDSPFKTVKDVVDAAKANPGKVRVTSTGVGTVGHNAVAQIEAQYGVKFATMFFDEGGEQRATLLGGHADVEANTVSETTPAFKSGEIRVLGLFDTQPSKFLPGVATAESQGIKVTSASSRGLAFPAGTPPEVVAAWSNTIKTILADPEHQAQLEKLSLTPRYLDTADYEKFWDDTDKVLKASIDASKKK